MTQETETAKVKNQHIVDLLVQIETLPHPVIIEILNYLTPEEIKAAIPYLPEEGSKIFKLFKEDGFWLLKCQKHFPNTQLMRKAGQTEFDFFWENYQEEYKDYPEKSINLFSLAKENKLSIQEIQDINDLYRVDKRNLTLLDWITLNCNQGLLNQIYQQFTPTLTSPLDWAITCLQPLDVINNLTHTSIDSTYEAIFIKAASCGHLELVRDLYEKVIKDRYMGEAHTEIIRGALLGATQKDRLEMVEYLISSILKDRPDQYLASWGIVLETAAFHGNTNLVKFAIDKDTQPVLDEQSENQHFYQGWVNAASEGHLSITELLIDNSNLKKVDISEALIIATDKKQWRTVEYLCELTTDNKPWQASISRTLTRAAEHGEWRLVQKLCQLQSDNRPSLNDLREIFLFSAQDNRYKEPAMQTFESLLPLVRANNFAEDLTNVFIGLVNFGKFDLATKLYNASPINNKPKVGEVQLRTLICNDQYSLYRIIFKRTHKEMNKKQLREHLRLASFSTVSDEFKFWLKNAASPESYDNLTSSHENKIDKICALLEDYTKKNSSFSRFFHGHWNRHHTEEIASIVDKIKNKTIELPDVVSQLKTIQPANKEGSIARRIQYILDRITVEDEISLEETIRVENTFN